MKQERDAFGRIVTVEQPTPTVRVGVGVDAMGDDVGRPRLSRRMRMAGRGVLLLMGAAAWLAAFAELFGDGSDGAVFALGAAGLVLTIAGLTGPVAAVKAIGQGGLDSGPGL